LPVPQSPHDRGVPVQADPLRLSAAAAEANTENFLESLVEPQRGHLAPCHLLERTRISLSVSHFSQ
jgi:hypothetical protein